ncbi:MAG: rhodanese-related sulfurtransferase [Myxococcota bacterium]|jgi:rhodanese-related sulfurtransferase
MRQSRTRQVDVRNRYSELSPGRAAITLAQYRVVDVRGAAEYRQGHLSGSALAPLPTLEAAVGSWERAAPVLLVCRSGQRSTRAAERMAMLGFTQVYNLTGGLNAWAAAALPLAGCDPC